MADEVQAMAKEKGCTPSQLALAWVLAQGSHVIPIPGTSSIPRLEENIAAAAVKLTQADKDRIDRFAPRGVAVGARYAPERASLLNG